MEVVLFVQVISPNPSYVAFNTLHITLQLLHGIVFQPLRHTLANFFMLQIGP